MRIAYVLEDARIDGTVRFVIRQTRLLRARGHAVRVFCGEGPLVPALRDAGAQVRTLRSLATAHTAGHAAERAEVHRALRGWDAAVAAAGRAFPFARACALDAPLYLDILSNDLFVGDDDEMAEAVRHAARDGRLIAHSRDDARAHAVRYGFDAGAVRFAPLPVEPGRIGTPLERAAFAAPSETLILSVARLDDDHAGYVRPLVAAVGALRASGYALRLVVAGGGRHAQALRADAPPYVTYLGARQDVEALYALADVYVGEGSSRLEAALSGLPTISSCAQTHPQLAGHALFLFGMQHGTLHAYGPTSVVAPASFEDAIALVLDDESLLETVRARGQARVASEHAPARYADWLEQLVAGHAPPPATAALRAPRPIDVVRGGDDVAELAGAAARAHADSARGVRAAAPVTWRAYAALPPAHWDALADASRRTE